MIYELNSARVWSGVCRHAEPLSHYPTWQVEPMLESNQLIWVEFNCSKRRTIHAPISLRYRLLKSCYTGQRFSVILEAVVSSAAIMSWNKTSRAQKEQFDWPMPLNVATQVAGKVLHCATWEKFLATLRNALRKVELTSTFRNKKIATNVCYTRQYFVQRIMFTVGNVDRYIDRYIGRHSIDIAVPSRSTVDRLAIDSRSTLDRLWSRGGQQSIDCRSRGGRQSIDCRTPRDRVSNDIAVDAPRPNIGHMSVAYRSTVGDTSVNCWWHISQLSVAYRSTVGGISVNCRSHISRVLI